jgi:hypothetical protein
MTCTEPHTWRAGLMDDITLLAWMKGTEMVPIYLRAEALAQAIDRLPDPETGAPVVALSIEPVRRFTKDPPKEAGETASGYVVRFRRERFGHGPRTWHEYVLVLPGE